MFWGGFAPTEYTHFRGCRFAPTEYTRFACIFIMFVGGYVVCCSTVPGCIGGVLFNGSRVCCDRIYPLLRVFGGVLLNVFPSVLGVD